jgi:hypothetical protein
LFDDAFCFYGFFTHFSSFLMAHSRRRRTRRRGKENPFDYDKSRNFPYFPLSESGMLSVFALSTKSGAFSFVTIIAEGYTTD